MHRELDDRRSIGIALNNLGELAQLQDDLEKAEDLYKQSMAVVREIDDKWLTVHVLLAAVDALRREMGFEFQAHTLADYERALHGAREELSKERFEAACQRTAQCPSRRLPCTSWQREHWSD